MSSLIVEVCNVDEIKPHPNADRMVVAKVKGWYVCVAKDPVTGQAWCKEGDKVVYFPPDTIIPGDVADKHGVTKYLAHLPKNEDGTRPEGGRVLVANLRSFKSYGYLAPLDDPNWEVGTDVASHYRVSKYEPPLKATQGDAERPNSVFHYYYDMENIRNFPTLFTEGEEVVVTEKIHGENCRLGLIKEINDDGKAVWKWAAGSHGVRRKRFLEKQDKEGNVEVVESVYWRCFTPEIKAYLADISGCGYTLEEIENEPEVGADGRSTGSNIVLFGERFGAGVQDMWYGLENGNFTFRAFDVTVDGRYMDFDAKNFGWNQYGIPAVPFVYRGPFSFDKITELAETDTQVCDPTKTAKKFKEGVVVFTPIERSVATKKKVFDRAQLKCISFAYLSRKDGTEFH